MLEQNESSLDKKIRLVVGIIALMLALFTFSGVVQIVAIIVAVLAIFTSLTGFCLIYKIFGIKTNN
jgi:uncharacterized membrane protein HdeD (DUF308 family)